APVFAQPPAGRAQPEPFRTGAAPSMVRVSHHRDTPAHACAARELDCPDYDALAPNAKALVDRRVAELGRAPHETAVVVRFLVVMVAVRLGELREMKRLVRDGRAVVILVDAASERFYQLDD